MDLWILTEVHNRAQEIEQTCKPHHSAVLTVEISHFNRGFHHHTSESSDISKQKLTFKALKRLKELSEGLGGELLVIFGSHLDADLQVLADVGREHGSQALQRVLH